MGKQRIIVRMIFISFFDKDTEKTHLKTSWWKIIGIMRNTTIILLERQAKRKWRNRLLPCVWGCGGVCTLGWRSMLPLGWASAVLLCEAGKPRWWAREETCLCVRSGKRVWRMSTHRRCGSWNGFSCNCVRKCSWPRGDACSLVWDCCVSAHGGRGILGGGQGRVHMGWHLRAIWRVSSTLITWRKNTPGEVNSLRKRVSVAALWNVWRLKHFDVGSQVASNLA